MGVGWVYVCVLFEAQHPYGVDFKGQPPFWGSPILTPFGNNPYQKDELIKDHPTNDWLRSGCPSLRAKGHP